MATHEYWPPATGQLEHISAIARAMKMVNTQTPIQPKIMTGGPPAWMPMMKPPLKAVQLFDVRHGSYARLREMLTMSQY